MPGALYPPVFELVCQLEGGYAANDNGRGAVNRGLTQKTWDGIRARSPQWHVYPESVGDLSREHMFGIYRDTLWAESGAFRIEDQKLAEAYFLNYINVAWKRTPANPNRYGNLATIALQSAAGAKADGVFGPASAAAVNRMEPDVLLHRMNVVILEHYERLAAEKPALYADDLKGWKARLKHLEER